MLETVRHPNVVQFVGAVTQNVPMMIVSEFHPRGDLRSYLQKKGWPSPSKALRFAVDIARQRIAETRLLRNKQETNIDKLEWREQAVEAERRIIGDEYIAPLKDFGMFVKKYIFGILSLAAYITHCPNKLMMGRVGVSSMLLRYCYSPIYVPFAMKVLSVVMSFL